MFSHDWACIISDIDLSTFLKFNRIRALTDEVKMIADAVAYKSELLQVWFGSSQLSLLVREPTLGLTDRVRPDMGRITLKSNALN